MSDENPSMSQTFQKSYIMNQGKVSTGVINNELLKNIEVLEEENVQLKLALTELQEDLKDKENSIEESQKLITKLKDEYSKTIKEYQSLEQINSELINENELNKKEIENARKTNNLVEKLQTKNNELNTEINVLKKENNSLKLKINTNNSTTNKKEKDLKNKEFLINNLKQKSDNWVLMVKERENVINEQSKKIKDLNEIISRQEEQLKLMMNFSKSINKENKTNISEITKQAVKTIKLYYNSLSNSENNMHDNGYRIEFKNSNKNMTQEFENILKGDKISFNLEDALNSMMYIPKNLKSISKEFIMDMNFKTELIKSELFTCMMRENHFVSFLNGIFGQFNPKDMDNFKSINKILIGLKNNLENIMSENNKLKKTNKILVQNKKNYELFFKKFKTDTYNNIKKLKENYFYLINNINSKIDTLEKNNLMMKEKSKNDFDKYNKEIINLKTENIELKNNLEEYKKLIDTQKENEKLYKSLAENNISNNTNRYLNRLSSYNNNDLQIISEINFNITHSYHSYINRRRNKSNKRYLTLSNDNNNNDDINSKNTLRMNITENNISNKNNKYHKKKKEIKNLKEEIEHVKNEINNIMLNSVNVNDMSLTFSKNNKNINNKINTIDNSNKNNTTRTTTNTNNNNNSNINDSNIQKKINNLQKSLKNEKNKNTNLENEIISLKHHINDLNNSIDNIRNRNIFSPSFFIKIFYNINQKIFSSSELKKYYKIYNTSDINIVFDIFIKSCECLKKQLYEINFEIDSPNSDLEENYVNSKNLAIDSSYRLVNEKILKLKKLEFDFLNLSEFVKNYLVSQEIIVNIIFSSDNNIIEFEPIEKLFSLFEECLNFKIDEMSDNVIFYRKLLIRIFKNQKNCLGLSLESLSQE